MAGVQQQVARIDKFLAKEMLESPKSEEEIQTMRTNQCVEVTIQGSNTVVMSIEDIEARWLQQNATSERVVVPSTDILEWKANCPLSQTTADIAASMKSQYESLFKEAEDKIKEKDQFICQELENFNENPEDPEGSARAIAEIVSDAVIVSQENKGKKTKKASKPSPVVEKLKRIELLWEKTTKPLKETFS